MRLLLLVLVVGVFVGGGFLVHSLLLPPSDPYLQLQGALAAPDPHVPVLWALALREDGAGWVARVELARVLLARGEAQAAVPLLREALALRESREARRLLARALEGSGRAGEALALWQELLPEGEAAEAVVRLETDKLAAARILVFGGAHAQALEALAGLTSPAAVRVRAQALAGLGRLAEAAREYEQYLARNPQDTQAQLGYGQVLERMGEREKARAAYERAGALGAYPLGLLLEAQGDLNGALSAYVRSPEAEAQWRAARILEEQGRFPEALRLYQELARGSARVADDAALRAYLLHVRRGELSQAEAMKMLLPPTFLWLLGEPVPPLPSAPDPPPTTPASVQVASTLVVRFPSEGPTWAGIELDLALRRAALPEILAIGEWYAARGEWRRAFSLGMRALHHLPCPRAWRLAYPRAWEENVLRWSQAYGVDPFLVWAVMREESGFLPTAVSSSGARGLMQLMPSTARWIAQEKIGLPYGEDLLFDPDYNIRLGTWYLRHLLDLFGGDVAWAVAAYNGGPGNLRRWTASGVARAVDLPAHLRSPETREYLVKVLNSWLVYRELYGK